MWREAINNNDFYRLSRKPFVIGVTGDSGSGKDTFSDALTGLFGEHSVVGLSGDNYHLWDRQKPMWQVMTHLNPMANDLEKFSNHLVSLVDGKTVSLREYDHETGQMGKLVNVKSNDFIIATGLHVLYLPILRECYDLKIYLQIDEGLRRYFKVKRDTLERGYSTEKVLKAFEDRASDSLRFIQPQVEEADLVMSLQPIHPRLIADFSTDILPRLKLSVVTRKGFNELSLKRVLIGVCGLHVDMVSEAARGEVHITIEGETSAEDIALAAEILCPGVFEFLDILPKWEDGPSGIMQLIALSHISQALTKRFI
jgi:uridine kinase